MNDDTWLTLVALREALLPSMDDMFAEIRRCDANAAEPTEVRTSPNAFTCRWGDAVVGVALVPRPIPSSLLEGPSASAWYWPEAAEAVAGHGAHVLINLVDESRDMIEKALRLTALTSAVATAADAVAILWAPAGLIHEPRAFAEQARQSSRESLPLYLWIDIRIQQQAENRHSLFTNGLARLGKREIELESIGASGQQVLEWAYNLAHYQLDRTAIIKDGDTIGLPDGTQFSVRHAKSRIDQTADVLLLQRMDEAPD
jgi:hypothetical protein